MVHSNKLQKLCHMEPKRVIFLLGIVAITHLMCQSIMLPYGSALLSLMAEGDVHIHAKNNFLTRNHSKKSEAVGDSRYVGEVKVSMKPDAEEEFSFEGRTVENVVDVDEFVYDDPRDENTMDVDESFQSEKIEIVQNTSTVEVTSKTRHGLSLGHVIKPSSPLSSSFNATILKTLVSDSSSSGGASTLQTGLNSFNNSSENPAKKKMRCDMPPKTVMSIQQMEHIFVRHRASSRSTKPRWSSIRDQEMLKAKSEILNAATVRDDLDLYAPLFRNVSMFKRSYELMESVLKVYVYKEGKKPIFHQPIMKGLYASEGWFMKLMEGNGRYVVKDPRKAHLFYMPFSSRMLEYSLYVRNSHNRTNLRQYLKEYTDSISTKYPFFKRTDGADHFLVACHDWAPYETRHHMEHCIKALCNADVTQGFKIARDVSLPETYVRSARDPHRDLGGKPASERQVLAFYAGSLHGYLRPILLKQWKDKDPDMKIYSRMPLGVASKMNYIQHMKSSKYCLCPKGYEVNSPRVVEAIFYECVPVIISDNFVPSFFEVLDWTAFSVILAEKDIPNLKNILLAIPETKYIQMQLAVRKVQRHFLWNAKPTKYDLFHMTLHSIWYNRVFQISGKK